MWRQTGNCDYQRGAREAKHDQNCSTSIKKGWSGYCECTNGKKAMAKGCAVSSFPIGPQATCDQACTIATTAPPSPPPAAVPTPAPTSAGWWVGLPGWEGARRQERKALNMGIEACVWSERIDPSNLDCRMWPRTSVIAEVAWGGRVSNEVDVRRNVSRVNVQLERLQHVLKVKPQLEYGKENSQWTCDKLAAGGRADRSRMPLDHLESKWQQ
jgi:hypothetical protein